MHQPVAAMSGCLGKKESWEYLVCSWPMPVEKRIDALSRTLSAALCREHSVHVLFGDNQSAMITFAPEFLEEWQQSGKSTNSKQVRKEERLLELVRQAFDSVPIKGVYFKRLGVGDTSLMSSVQALVKDRFQQVLFLDKNAESCALRFDGPKLGGLPSSPSLSESTLFVLGGVANISDRERVTIEEVCVESQRPHHKCWAASVADVTSHQDS